VSEICTVCQTTGPVLMPLRYAIVPDYITQQLPAWATPHSPFPALAGYHYALRTVRQGFIYVFYDTGAHPDNAAANWQCWSVAETGDVYYQGTRGLGAQAVYNPLPCGRPVHNAINLEHIVLDQKALKYETWVAFSHAPWEEETLNRYASSAGARKARMQSIVPSEWRPHVSPQENGLITASEDALGAVLDYQLRPSQQLPDAEKAGYRVSSRAKGVYQFHTDAVRPHTTAYTWSRRRAGRAERSMKAMQARCVAAGNQPVTPLLLALQDPVGIAHELAHWCDGLTLAHQCYQDELNIEFWTWRTLNGLQNQISQMTTSQQAAYTKAEGPQDLQLLYRTMAGTYSREQIKQFYEEGTAWANRQGVAYEWSKYDNTLNHTLFGQFRQNYGELCKTLDDYMQQLVGLRLQWLGDDRFINAIQDHNSSRPIDYLYYREIVGYAIASVNVVPAGRRQVQAWINEYSTASPKNLFWRSQFFNDPTLMPAMADMLSQMKANAAKRDEPGESDPSAVMAVLKSLSGPLGMYNESCARALEEMEKHAGKTNLPFVRKILLWSDRRLTTFTTEVFNRSVLGRVIDSVNDSLYRRLFLYEAGLREADVEALMKREAVTSGHAVSGMDIRSRQLDVRRDALAQFIKEYNNVLNSPEGARHIDMSRVRFLGVIFYSWEFCSQMDERVTEGKGSLAELMSAGLFAVSTAIQVTLPAIKVMVKSARDEGSPYKIRLETLETNWDRRANACGTAAAALAVIADLGELAESFDEDGASRWKAVGLSSVKLLTDSAYAVQSSEDLFKLLGIKTIQAVIEETVGSSAEGILIFIDVLASWPVMVLVAIASVLAAIFSDSDLQTWCEKCIFGNGSVVEDTWLMPADERSSVQQEQEDALVKALHETFGLPLTERVKAEEEAEAHKKAQPLTTLQQSML